METTTKPDIWKDYLPDYVNLYYVDYNSDLSNHANLLQDCVSQNNLYPLSETIYDWWDFPEDEYINQIQRDMENDDVEWNDDWIDEIKEWLWENDKSTPIDDLLRNTGEVMWFYSLGVCYGELWRYDHYDDEQFEEDVKEICELLNIAPDSPQVEKIKSIRAESYYGGELRIYFKTELKKLLTEKEDDFSAIQFKGKFSVALIDRMNGSGYYEDVELDLTLEFDRSNLFHAKCEKYNIFEIFGIDNSCIEDDEPKMLMEMPAETKEVAPSFQGAYLEAEAEYNRVFKAGGCTKGDMDITRHRHTTYRNSFPCGHICQDCGTFWID